MWQFRQISQKVPMKPRRLGTVYPSRHQTRSVSPSLLRIKVPSAHANDDKLDSFSAQAFTALGRRLLAGQDLHFVQIHDQTLTLLIVQGAGFKFVTVTDIRIGSRQIKAPSRATSADHACRLAHWSQPAHVQDTGLFNNERQFTDFQLGVAPVTHK